MERAPSFSAFKFDKRSMESKYSKSRVARELREAEDKECTFKPKLNEYVRESGMGHSRGASSTSATIERLSRNKREDWEARERIRLEAEERALRESCTFRPKLVSSQRAADKAAQEAAAPAVPVEVRLINDANNRNSLRQRAKRHIEEQELIRTCTFKPKINTTSRYLDANHRPLHERVGELQREKRMKLQEARVREEKSNPDLTFKPTINEKSVRIAQADKSIVGNVTQRLCERTEASLQKKMNKMAEIAMEREKEQTFRPSINPNSERIITASDEHAGDFYERRRQALIRKAMKAPKPEEHPFKPTIGATSRLLAEEREKETPEERIERLAYRMRDKQKGARESVHDEYYSQFTFQPQINKISKQLGSKHSVEELHNNHKRRERIAELLRQAQEAQEAECTFQPNVHRRGANTRSMNDLSEMSGESVERSRYSIDVHDTDTLTQRIALHAKRKNAAIEQERRRREYEDLKECTFTPAIHQEPARQPSGPIIVRGLGRHLELQELARKKEEERLAREKKVFMLPDEPEKSLGVPKPYTVPQPFKLSSNDSKHEEKRKALRSKLEKEKYSECTFQPKVNDGRVKEYMDRLLHQEISEDGSVLSVR